MSAVKPKSFIRRFVNVEEKGDESAFMAIFVGVFAAFGGILFGYDTGTISGVLAMDYVLETFPDTPGMFTSSENSLIVSILSLGTFLGSLVAPYFNDWIGRRLTLILSSLIVFNLGIILQTASTGIPLLVAGRVFAGLGVGLISSTVPLYQSECVPKWIRGALVSFYQFAITIGLLLANIVNNATHKMNNSGSYRIPIAIQFLWALILGIGFIFLPESPRFWVKREKKEEALNSLHRLRRLPVDHPEVIEEYEEIRANHEYEMSLGSSGWLDCFKSSNHQRLRIFTGISLQALQQLTGVNFVFYYGVTFFKNAGINNSFLISVVCNVINCVCTIPGIVLVELLGRRPLILSGALGMFISDYIVSITSVASNDSGASNNVMIAFICIFIAFFAATWGPICWVIVGEIFPLRVRAKSIALSTSSNWLWNFGIAYATPYLVDSGPGNADLGPKVYFIWGSCNLLCLIFGWFFVYETKNLKLEQIDELYDTCKPWKSSKFVPTTYLGNHATNEAGSYEADPKLELDHSDSRV
ncbi:hypothetical protein DASC09_012460 [Saccharomycopsis crataegensis]|uniref:Major facilitator superfamily (MFS) profile domain-containing protein n=1 Tax=Saccharomycopsis crataegensis TaxID=43959 RepID=A0AAV5QGT1_9ASCO|nr:hypothetical protein DASC09_012460 [Saccharomycopsis crataegensis]